MKQCNIIFLPITIVNGMATSKRLFNFFNHLNNIKGYTFTNIVHEPNENAKIFIKETTIGPLVYQKITYNRSKIIFAFGFLYLNFKLLLKNYKKESWNVFYHSGYPNIKNILIILFAKLIGYKIMFDIVEDNSTITKFNSPWLRFKNNSSLFFIKMIPYFADGIVCISEQLYSKLKPLTKNRIPLIHIPGSFNDEIFSNIYPTKLNRNRIILFYGGSFGEKDGLYYLLSAFDIIAEQNNVELILSGKGSKKDMDSFFRILNGIRNKGRIKYLGYLEDIVYFETLKTADILFMVRISSDFAQAGFPFKLAEILATGKPVIATKVGVVKEYLSEYDAFLIDPENIGALVDAIQFIINNPEIAYEVGQNGRKVAFEHFSSEKITKDLMSFIERIVTIHQHVKKGSY